MQKELDAFGAVLENPKRPVLAILGGAKVADKIPLIRNLLDKADELIIGGGMTFTFKKVLDGMEIGESMFDPEGAKIVGELMEKAKAKGVKIHLPVDFICGDKFDAEAKTQLVEDKAGYRPAGRGSTSVIRADSFSPRSLDARKPSSGTDLPGVFEFERFAEGTKSMAEAIAAATDAGAISVVGGGDTATAAKKFKVD